MESTDKITAAPADNTALFTRTVLDKTIPGEANGEYTLPDYMPEIIRLLRVGVSISPLTAYIGGGNAEFSCRVSYMPIYVGDDGGLYSYAVSEDCDFSCPLPDEYAADITADCVRADAAEDSCTTRLLGPRKLSIRSKLSCRIRADAKIPIESAISGAPGDVPEKLKREVFSAETYRSQSDEITLDGDSPADESGIRPVFCEGSIHVGGASLLADGIECRGESYLSSVCVRTVDGGEELFQNFVKVPFTVTIPFNSRYEAGENRDVRAWGQLTSVNVTSEAADGHEKLVYSAGAVVYAEITGNRKLSVTEDMYSRSYESECEYKNIKLPRALRSGNGNFTLSGSAKAELGEDARVISATGNATVTSVEAAKGKYAVGGKCQISALACSKNGEITKHDLELPFKYELEGAAEQPDVWDCKATVLYTRARADGKEISADAEIGIAVSMGCEKSVRVVSAMHADQSKPIPRACGTIEVYYPERTADGKSAESLWQICRQCHAKIADVRAANDVSGDASDPANLDKVDFVVTGM